MIFNDDFKITKMKLNEISDVIDSLHKTPKYSKYGYNMVRVKDLEEGYLNLINTNKVSEKVYKEFTKKYEPKKGDIILSRVGSYGISSYVNTDEKFCLGQNTVVINPNDNMDNKYLYYCLISKKTKNQIEKLVVGTTQRTISLKNIRNLVFSIPPLRYQKKISSFFSAIDEKIKNNNKMNKTLEEMAQAIFKSWFIDFEPFQDGEFIESDLGMIPESWEVVPFENLFEFQKGKTPKNKSKEKKDGYLKYLTISVLSGKKTVYGEPTKNNTLVNENDVVMVMDGSSSGKIFFGTSGIVASTLAKLNIINDKISNGFIYLLAKYYEKEFMKNTTGSAVPHADKKYILNKKIAIPKDKSLLNDFNKSINDIRTKISLNKQENQTLKKLRDSLLPKLMSGEIRVPIEESAKEVN